MTTAALRHAAIVTNPNASGLGEYTVPATAGDATAAFLATVADLLNSPRGGVLKIGSELTIPAAQTITLPAGKSLILNTTHRVITGGIDVVVTGSGGLSPDDSYLACARAILSPSAANVPYGLRYRTAGGATTFSPGIDIDNVRLESGGGFNFLNGVVSQNLGIGTISKISMTGVNNLGRAVLLEQVAGGDPTDVLVREVSMNNGEATVYIAGGWEGVRVQDCPVGINNDYGVYYDGLECPAATTLAASASAGATSLTLVDAAGISIGTALAIETGTTNAFGKKNHFSLSVASVTGNVITMLQPVPAGGLASGQPVRIPQENPLLLVADNHFNVRKCPVYIRGANQIIVRNNHLYRFDSNPVTGGVFVGVKIDNPPYPNSGDSASNQIVGNVFENTYDGDNNIKAFETNNTANVLIRDNDIVKKGTKAFATSVSAQAGSRRVIYHPRHINGASNDNGILLGGDALEVNDLQISPFTVAANSTINIGILNLNGVPPRMMVVTGVIMLSTPGMATARIADFQATFRNPDTDATVLDPPIREEFIVNGASQGAGAYTWGTGQTFNITISGNTIVLQQATAAGQPAARVRGKISYRIDTENA